MQVYAVALWMPLTLMINLSLFQYLLTVYFHRRREIRVILLCVHRLRDARSFALPSEDLHDHLNGISEVSPTLTFIIQIEIIGRDILRKVRIRSLHYLTIVAEMFCLFGFFMMIKSVVAICRPNFNLEVLEPLDSIMEDGGLFFVFVFRFYFLALSVGIRGVLRTKSLELFAYFLFVTHDYPWDIIGYYPDASWEPAAAMWMRVTMMMCIMLTIRDKLQLEVSHNSVAGPSKDVSLKSPPNKSMGPKH